MYNYIQSVGFAESFKPFSVALSNDRAITASIHVLTDEHASVSDRIAAYNHLSNACSKPNEFSFLQQNIATLMETATKYAKSFTFANVQCDGVNATLFDLATKSLDKASFTTSALYVGRQQNIPSLCGIDANSLRTYSMQCGSGNEGEQTHMYWDKCHDSVSGIDYTFEMKTVSTGAWTPPERQFIVTARLKTTDQIVSNAMNHSADTDLLAKSLLDVHAL